MDCKTILLVEDDANMASLIREIIRTTLTDVDIYTAPTLEDALPKIDWADLVITDFEYPSSGFRGLLPTLQKKDKFFILQSGGLKYLKIYDDYLQLDSIYKSGTDFIPRIQKAIKLFTQI